MVDRQSDRPWNETRPRSKRPESDQMRQAGSMNRRFMRLFSHFGEQLVEIAVVLVEYAGEIGSQKLRQPDALDIDIGHFRALDPPDHRLVALAAEEEDHALDGVAGAIAHGD